MKTIILSFAIVGLFGLSLGCQQPMMGRNASISSNPPPTFIKDGDINPNAYPPM
jgi:hypothetical protein